MSLSHALIHLACNSALAADVAAAPVSFAAVPPVETPSRSAPTPPTAPVVHEARLSGGAAPGASPAGAHVLLVERRDLPLARVELSFETGALVEAGRVGRGALDALGATWLDGTRAAPGDTWRARVEARGGVVSGDCGNVRCWFALTAPRDTLPELLPALGELVHAPAIPAHSVTRWRLAAEDDRRATCLGRAAVEEHAVARLLWPEGHPYRDERTRDDTLVSRGAVRAAWRTVVAEGAPTLAVVGGVTLPELLPTLEASFGRLAGAAGGPSAGPLRPAARLVLVDDYDDAPARITVAWPSPGSDHADHAAWELVSVALLDGFTSRLNLRLREREGFTYTVDGAYTDEPGFGLTTVELVVAEEAVGLALAAVTEELDAMRREGPAMVEVTAALRQAWARASEEIGTFAGLTWRLWLERHFGQPPGETVRRLAAYRDVSQAEATAAAARWLAEPRLVVVTGEHDVVGPSLDAAGFRVTDHWTSRDAVGECPAGD